MADDSALLQVLSSLRTYGALGEASLPDAIQHAESFLAAIPSYCTSLVDLGSGGGLPGLVLALRLPQAEIVLTDRRERRTDLLRRACSRLQIDNRVSVITGDVARLSQQVQFAGMFEAATARAFGSPLWTMMCAAPFLRVGGIFVASEPPDGLSPLEERWPADEVMSLGFRRHEQRFSRVTRFNFTG